MRIVHALLPIIGLASMACYRPLPELVVNNHLVYVEIVDSPGERAMGLSGRGALKPNRGMLFVFDQRPQPAWMLGMNFPLDLIWISRDWEVLEVVHGAPAAPPGVEPIRYKPPAGARYLLEITAGHAARFQIEPGASVELAR